MTGPETTHHATTDADRAADAALVASRALLGVVASSLADALEDVTLPQFRVLVVLRTGGAQRMGALAQAMDVNPSTFSRFIDRMVDGGWIVRRASPDSRREVLIDLTPQGEHIVDQVSQRRRREIRRILAGMPAADRHALTEALERFAVAAGEPSARDLLVLGL
ncbi:MarR family winged helix-turn-helix transcriptional regulator [Pseudolysinimonas sp.]|uniref:MarR family winged helix-turn-helix transcriptional regulator n=1 Tax=Pseudolysinimonas sp. TaxID=2680009 RepID=UPI003F7D758A